MVSYRTIQLPIDFIDKYIDGLIQDKASGYNSRASVVKAGIRNLHGIKTESEHRELLLFIIKAFMDSGLSIDFPDHLEQELREIIRKEF